MILHVIIHTFLLVFAFFDQLFAKLASYFLISFHLLRNSFAQTFSHTNLSMHLFVMRIEVILYFTGDLTALMGALQNYIIVSQ